MLTPIFNLPPGIVMPYAGSSVPAGWLDCDGSAVSRSTYEALFTVVGTTYGSGNGSTTFNVPDLRGRTVIGVGTGSGLTARSLNDSGGEETHTLASSEMPSHTHQSRIRTDANFTYGGANSVDSGVNYTGVGDASGVGSTGGGGAHNNMQPWRALRYIIKA